MTRRWGALTGALAVCACTDAADPLFDTLPVNRFFVTDSNPAMEATGVPTDAVVDVGLSEPALPASVGHAWELRTGAVRVTGGTSIDLVDRRLYIRAARGMFPHLAYTVTLRSSLRSFSGATLEPTVLRFTTAAGPALPRAPAPARSLAGDVIPALKNAGCADVGCHRAPTPARGLSLDSASALLGIAAKAAGSDPAVSLITPGAHATSFLVWKALGLPRLPGHRSPTLSHDQARALADWIDQGANP